MSIQFNPGRTKLQAVRISTPDRPPAFATFNPARTGGLVLSNGNLKVSPTDTFPYKTSLATVGHAPAEKRKLYAEFRIVGVANRLLLVQEPYDVSNVSERFVSIYPYARDIRVGNDTFDTGTTLSPSTESSAWIFSVWWDGSFVNWSFNGVRADAPDPRGFQTTGVFDPATKVYPAVAALRTAGGGDNIIANFGGSAWRYAPPAGYEGWAS